MNEKHVVISRFSRSFCGDGWIRGCQGIISDKRYVNFKLSCLAAVSEILGDGYLDFMFKDGYVVFKPSSLAAIQRIISVSHSRYDGAFFKESTLDNHISLSRDNFLK